MVGGEGRGGGLPAPAGRERALARRIELPMDAAAHAMRARRGATGTRRRKFTRLLPFLAFLQVRACLHVCMRVRVMMRRGVCVCAQLCVCVCERVCVRARVRACVRACGGGWVCAWV